MLTQLLNPLWWFSFFGESFSWLLVCEIFSLAVFPICFLVFRVFKDRGYAFAKIFGIFFITYINWYLCTVLNFSFFSIFVALIIASTLSFFCFLKQKERIIAFFRKSWKMILIYELIFLFSFLFFLNVRSYSPEAMWNPSESGAEKMLNSAYLHGLLRTKHFPPGDTWLWGERDVKQDIKGKKAKPENKNAEPEKEKLYINYYYFGHLQWATLAKFSGNPGQIAFNLGLATIFALTFLGAFSLGCNLTRKFRWGFFAAFMVALFGNIDALQQMLETMGYWIAHKGNSSAWDSIMAHKNAIFYSVDFWRTSRVIDNTVTEFPYFSAILGDLHPHHSSLPTVLLVMGAGMSLFMTVSRKTMTLIEFFKRYWLNFFFFALVIGATFVTNTWDAIVMGFFGTVIMTYLGLRRWGNSWKGIGHCVLTVAVLGISALSLFMLFKIYFHSPVKNEIKYVTKEGVETFDKLKLMVVPLKAKLRTHLSDYFVLFGLFLFPVIFYFYGLYKNYQEKNTKRNRGIWVVILLFFLIIFRNIWHFWLLGILMIWLVLIVTFLLKGDKGRRTNFFFLLCFVAGFFSLFVETFYFDDRMVGTLERYNTLFKIFYPLWSFLAICAVYSFSRMFRGAIKKRNWRKLVWLGIFLAATFYVGMLYPVQSTCVRTEHFHPSTMDKSDPKLKIRSIDSTAYMHRDKSFSVDIGHNKKKSVNLKDDAKIIDWIRDNVKGQPVVLEAVGGCYVPFSRISSMTGLPTIVGWSHHVAQHRGGDVYDYLGPREADVKTIYSTGDIKKAKKLMKKYDITYVMVGAMERAKYSDRSLAKFSSFMKCEIKEGDSALYSIKK
jgi:YYY domain-containing protein